MNDLRDACRSLRAAPTVSLFAILSLGLGIGSSVAVFSIANALLFRTLRVHEPERLALVGLRRREIGIRMALGAFSATHPESVQGRRRE